MKKFYVDSKVFEVLPSYCLGIVVAEGINNKEPNAAITQMLNDEILKFHDAHQNDNIREIPNISAYREALQKVSINPNRYMCSIEALAKRVKKNASLPHINPIVDLGNAFSLEYVLPMGAHDIDRWESSDFAIRFAEPGDHFTPMGTKDIEVVPSGELIYVSGHTVKTRRWIWRQSEDGKITDETSWAFFPIDGFEEVNGDSVTSARDELAAFLVKEFDCKVKKGYVNKKNNTFEF